MTMASNVQLKHQFFGGDRKFYFYEGSVDVKGGVISLPVSHPEWVQRAYTMGYRADPDGGKVLSWNEVVTRMTQEDSSEEHDEDTDSGRQPDADNRLREGESDSSRYDDDGGAPSFVRRRSRVDGHDEGSTAGSDEVPTDEG